MLSEVLLYARDTYATLYKYSENICLRRSASQLDNT